MLHGCVTDPFSKTKQKKQKKKQTNKQKMALLLKHFTILYFKYFIHLNNFIVQDITTSLFLFLKI